MNKSLLSKLKILYVEDEDEVREFTGKTIQTIVKELIIAKDGSDGFNKFLENQDIDLIITDINMPKLSGLDMCENIKKINPHVPIIITTAYNDAKFLKKAIEVDVNSYSMKPIDLYKLISNISKVIEPTLFAKELDRLNLSLDLKNKDNCKKVKTLLNKQNNIVFIYDGQNILESNEVFNNFFSINSIEDFLKKNRTISDYFIEENGFFSTSLLADKNNWMSHIINDLSEIDKIVKLKNNNNEDRIFTINIIKNYQYFIISLTDITDLEEKTTLLNHHINHDKLTGLYNKNKFNKIFDIELKRDKRYHNNLSLILLCINEDNQIPNDKRTDEIVKSIADIIINCVREHDTVIKFDEREFVILLPETDINGAKSVSNKIKEKIEIYQNDLLNIKLHINFGISNYEETSKKEDLLEEARKSLLL